MGRRCVPYRRCKNEVICNRGRSHDLRPNDEGGPSAKRFLAVAAMAALSTAAPRPGPAAAAALVSAELASSPTEAAFRDKTRDIGVIPCDLPEDAAKTVPAPFDNYMELVCEKAGQGLRPLDGYRFIV